MTDNFAPTSADSLSESRRLDRAAEPDKACVAAIDASSVRESRVARVVKRNLAGSPPTYAVSNCNVIDVPDVGTTKSVPANSTPASIGSNDGRDMTSSSVSLMNCARENCCCIIDRSVTSSPLIFTCSTLNSAGPATVPSPNRSSVSPNGTTCCENANRPSGCASGTFVEGSGASVTKPLLPREAAPTNSPARATPLATLPAR